MMKDYLYKQILPLKKALDSDLNNGKTPSIWVEKKPEYWRIRFQVLFGTIYSLVLLKDPTYWEPEDTTESTQNNYVNIAYIYFGEE